MDALLAFVPSVFLADWTGRQLVPLISVAALTLAWAIWTLYPRRLAVHNLPGPPSPGWLLGNFDEFATAEAGDELDRWFAQYGPTVVFADLFGRTRVSSLDPAFINHILKDSLGYEKDSKTQSLTNLYALDSGLFSAEGDMHKRQRRVIAPVFSLHTVAQFHPLFLDKSYELRDRLLKELPASDVGRGTEVDIAHWTRRLTLDIIGLAAFDYKFDSIQHSNNELYVALHDAFYVSDSETNWVLLQTLFPILRQLRTPTGRTFLKLERVMRRIAADIVKVKKAAVLEAVKYEGKDEVQKSAVEGNNLIAKIVRANLASDVPASQRLTDHEVAAQVGTFLIAGFMTTAVAIAWLLHALAEDPQVQNKLRDELLGVPDDRPSASTLNGLPYLDAVIRETLRLYAPATDVAKVARREADVVPLSTPVIGRDGKVMNEVIIERGVEVVVSIVNVSRSKQIWGEDAHEFRPERWLRDSPISDAAKGYDSAWGNMLTFSAGPRSCVGYRFAIEELKAMVFVLVRSFTFAPFVPKVPLHRFSIFFQVPKIQGKIRGGRHAASDGCSVRCAFGLSPPVSHLLHCSALSLRLLERFSSASTKTCHVIFCTVRVSCLPSCLPLKKRAP